MRFQCTFDYLLQPKDPSLYLRPCQVDVICFTDTSREVAAARLAFDHLDISRTNYDRQDILEICDSDSEGWLNVYKLIFEPGREGELKDEFAINDSVFDVMLLYRAVFHPALRDYQMLVLEHLSTLFGKTSAFVLWRNKTELTDEELSNLGFRRIVSSGLCLRLNMLESPFSSQEEPDLDDLLVPEDAEEWLDIEWGED
ncbi:MAG: hypothetical protein AAGB04_01445 [Pseudomonadota bacterium]